MSTPNETSIPPAVPPSPLERLVLVKRYRADNTLIQGEDYGVIPRSQSQKPTLLKPGAQKLCGLFGLAPTIKKTERVFKDDLIAYEVHYQVVNKESGTVEGEGLGMCNSRERKYKNQDQYDLANTLLKMAGKRALIDATLNALGISSLFTQDIEDMDLPAEKPISVEAPPEALANDKQRKGIEALAARFWTPETYAGELEAYLTTNYNKALTELTVSEAKTIYRMFENELAKPSQPIKDDAVGPSTARLDSIQDLGGYSRFLNACGAAGLPFSNDDDVAAFENAATPKAGMAVVVEDLSDDDWHGWAAMVEGGQLTWAGENP